VAGDEEQRGGQERRRAEAVLEEEGKGKGRETSLVPDKAAPARVAMATGGDRRLHVLRRERGHYAVTGSVLSDVSAVRNRRGLLTGGSGLVKYIFKFSNSTQICKFKKEAFICSKNIKTLYAAIFE
jgi:hypothetical protein